MLGHVIRRVRANSRPAGRVLVQPPRGEGDGIGRCLEHAEQGHGHARNQNEILEQTDPHLQEGKKGLNAVTTYSGMHAKFTHRSPAWGGTWAHLAARLPAESGPARQAGPTSRQAR